MICASNRSPPKGQDFRTEGPGLKAQDLRLAPKMSLNPLQRNKVDMSVRSLSPSKAVGRGRTVKVALTMRRTVWVCVCRR